MLNKFIGIGYVGKKGVELRYTTSGKATASFSLGMKRQFKNQQGEYEWDNLTVVAWGPQAEACANHLNPGSMCAAEGRIAIRTFDGQDGQKRWITEVIADNVRFLSPKDGQAQREPGDMPPEDSIPF